MSVVKGDRIIYLYRILSEASTSDATGIAFTTENSKSISRDSDSVSTKDGTIRVPKNSETEIKTTAIFSSEGKAMIDKLKEAVKKGTMVEVWEVNLDVKGTETADLNKYASTYFHAYVTSFELTSNSEDHAEASLDFAVDGDGVDGYATVSDSQQTVAALAFKDTAKSA
jgi:TP901-1 family phage major tail protein